MNLLARSRRHRWSRPLLCSILALAAFFIVAHADAKVQAYLDKPDDWYATNEARQIAASVLSYQSAWGGWPKNTDTADKAYTGDPLDLHPTFDNSATVDELRFLGRMFRVTKDERYHAAFERGLDYVLIAQYPTGGWPQSYPPDDYYHRYITFNDNAMVRVLEFVREVGRAEAFTFLGKERRAAALASFDRGIDCILKCQIKVDGKFTAWCAQHDEEDYSPRPARSFELVSLSGSESVGIVKLLMSLEHPSPSVVQAVNAAVAWMQQVALHGIREVKERDPKFDDKNNKRVIEDPAAPDLWARFYEIGTNKPIFSDRDGVAKAHLEDIGFERRNGYGWLGAWPRSLIEKQYAKWKTALAKLSSGAGEGVNPSPAPLARIALGGDETVTDHEGWVFGLRKKLATGVLCYDLSGKAMKNAHIGAATISDAAVWHDVLSPTAPLPAKERLVYLSDAWWKKTLAAKPDYLLLQFDGNEATSANGADDKTAALVQQISLAVGKARSAGIAPVLVTALPVWRMASDGKLEPEPNPAPAIVKQAASAEKTPLIDLYAQGLAVANPLAADTSRRLWQPSAAKEAPPAPSTVPQTGGSTFATPSLAPPVAVVKKRLSIQMTPEGRELFGEWVAKSLGREIPAAKALLR